MVEYSARALREAELGTLAAEARAEPQKYRRYMGQGPHHPLPNPNPTVQPMYGSSPVGLANRIALADRIAHPYKVP